MNALRALLSACLLLVLLACAAIPLKKEGCTPQTKGSFRIMTYNINWGESTFEITTPYKTINVIRQAKADLIFLQEVTPWWHSLLKNSLAKEYPYILFKPSDCAGGLAVLSKYPITAPRYTKSSIGWHYGMIMAIKTPYGVFEAANLHLTPPLISKTNLNFSLSAYFSSQRVREQEIKHFYQYFQHHRPLIVAGDFNEGDRGLVNQFLTQQGLSDVLHGSREFSWSWRQGFFVLKRKLDHIFYSQQLRPVYKKVIYDGNSDHYPIVVDLKPL